MSTRSDTVVRGEWNLVLSVRRVFIGDMDA